MTITAHFESRYHGDVTVRAERSPAEPDVGIFRAQWEIETSTDAEGQEIALNDEDERLAFDALDEAWSDLISGRSDYNAEPSYDLDSGFDPYMGSYSDDC